MTPEKREVVKQITDQLGWDRYAYYPVILEQTDFKVDRVKVKVKEEKNGDFKIFMKLETLKPREWVEIETITPKDKEDAREIRKMKRFPDKIYAAGIVVGEDEEHPELRLAYYYTEKGEQYANGELINLVMQEFFDYKGFKTLTEAVNFVDEDAAMKEKLMDMKMRFGGKF